MKYLFATFFAFIIRFCHVSAHPAPAGKNSNLTVTLDSITHDSVTVNEMAGVSRINAWATKSGDAFVVMGYTMAISNKNGSGYLANGIGNQLTKDMKAHLQRLKPGDVIIIGNIKANGKAGAKDTGSAVYVVIGR